MLVAATIALSSFMPADAVPKSLLNYFRPPPQLDTRTEHQTTYFRLKVALSHKGRPIDFDIVVGCGVRTQSRGYDGRSVEIMDMYPLVYAMPIPGGHAVKVRTLPIVDGYGICQNAGTSDNGAVPAGWMPFVTWYDDATDLSHGIGYATPDAYANPNSQLKYHGARITAATKEDFEAFKATKPANLVPAYNAGWMTVLDRPRIQSDKDLTWEFIANPRSAWRMVEAPWCSGVVRVKLDARQRALVAPHWPANHPRIWTLEDWRAQTALRDALWPPRVDRPDLESWASADLFHFPRRGSPPAIYPSSYGIRLAHLDVDTGKDGILYIDSRIGDGVSEKGFVDCDADVSGPILHAVTGRDAYRIPVPVCRVDGVTIPTKHRLCESRFWVAFERDEYVIYATTGFKG